MLDVYIVVVAIVFLVLLGTVSKIYQQVTELRTTLSKVSSTMSAETASLRKQLGKLEEDLDLIFRETKLARPTITSG